MDDLQVIAESRRRQILSLVWDTELSASTIAAQFDVTFGAISQHLSVLRQSGMVTVRREGNHRYYKADRQRLEPYRSILESMWGETLQHLASTIEASEAEER